ncbi:MAG TPA: hypothetical protein VJW76_15845, partial [Verrucomicrobiae bacterium]|nr:hypothetical protein [Verrucomicrobiae bacterium]
MSSLLSAGKKLVLLVLFGFAGAVSWSCWGQSTYLPQEAEYWISRGMVGDQVRPKVAVNTAGGYIVWQDNATDGDGLGISARALSSSFSPVLQRTFRVNQQIAGDQENPDVALVPTGGAVLAWQGGRRGSQRVYARFLGQDGAFSTGEIAVSSDTTGDNADACVVGLADGTAVVIWSNWGQDGSMQGVYGQRVSSSGAKLGSEFRANEFAAYNQRSPAVAALGNGGFVVAWASEQQRFERSVDVYARLFNSAGEPVASEFRLNSGTNVCANPVVASDGSDGFVAAWSELDLEQVENGWDVFLRTFGLTGVAAGEPVRLNGRLAGKQYAPRIASIGRDHLVVWTSLGQDQSREGVFGRFIRGGELAGNEFLVNTTTMSHQMEPA